MPPFTPDQLDDIRLNWDAEDDDFVLSLSEAQVDAVTAALNAEKVPFRCGIYERDLFVVVGVEDEGELLKAVREAGVG